MTDRIWNWPAGLVASGQLFHVPGTAIDGGITTGGARVLSPEPAGFSRLEFEPALAVGEWGAPAASWIASKSNGQIFKIQLAITPQIATADPLNIGKEIAGFTGLTYHANALAGSNTMFVDFTGHAHILKPGHVIGHDKFTYMVDEIIYDSGTNIAEIIVTPPLRKNIAIGDPVLFRPFFCGTIQNGADIIDTYKRENVGNFQFPKIIFDEAIPNE